MKTPTAPAMSSAGPEVLSFPSVLDGRPPRNVRAALRWGLRKLEGVLAVIGLGAIIYHACFSVSVVVSGSMSPTLQGESPETGDWVLTECLSYALREPRRWEVVTFGNREGLQIMKRVVALPGETVALTESGAVLIGGEAVPRPESLGAIEYFACGKLHRGRAAEAGGGYFVLGDDSRDSWDSRYTPPLERRRIAGRAWLRVWPPARIGFVNP